MTEYKPMMYKEEYKPVFKAGYMSTQYKEANKPIFGTGRAPSSPSTSPSTLSLLLNTRRSTNPSILMLQGTKTTNKRDEF